MFDGQRSRSAAARSAEHGVAYGTNHIVKIRDKGPQKRAESTQSTLNFLIPQWHQLVSTLLLWQ